MAELVVCAAAVVATPTVLFGVEQTTNRINRRLAELNSNIDDTPEPTQRGGLLCSRSTSQRPERTLEETKDQTPSDSGKHAYTEAATLAHLSRTGSSLTWTDKVDQGALYLDQLLFQRSKELKKAVSELMAPTTQTSSKPRKPPRKVSNPENQTSLSDILNSPQDETMGQKAHLDTSFNGKGPDVWVALGSQESKVSFQKGSPEVTYIFVPARAA